MSLYVEVNRENAAILDECFNTERNADANEDQVAEAFRVFDLENDHALCRDDLGVLLRQTLGLEMTDEDIDDFINIADLNKDGKIDFREFRRMMLPDRPDLASRQHTEVKDRAQGSSADKDDDEDNSKGIEDSERKSERTKNKATKDERGT